MNAWPLLAAVCGFSGLVLAGSVLADEEAATVQAITLVRVVSVRQVLVRAAEGDRVLELDTVQPDNGCAPTEHLAWVRELLPPGTDLWLQPAGAQGPARLWLRWRDQRVEWSLLLLRLGHAVMPLHSRWPAKVLKSYVWAMREARAEGRGVWGECGRRRSRFSLAARVSGIPERVLLAMAEVESGLGGQPWPWTLNIAGRSYFFLTRTAALRRLLQLESQHFDRVDVGLMQVNWHYHRSRFRDVGEAIDPEINQAVAAHILREHLQRTGNIALAVARYHSASPGEGQAYLARVLQRLRQAQGEAGPHQPSAISSHRAAAKGGST